MKATLIAFGEIQVAEERFSRDVVIDAGRIGRRAKGPSKAMREQYGHTPLSAAEDIPWGGRRLVVETGSNGLLPVTPDVDAEAARRGIELAVLPTSDACRLLADLEI